MRARSKEGSPPLCELPAPYDRMFAVYAAALAGSSLAASSRAAYLVWVTAASARGLLPAGPLADTVMAVRTAHAYHGLLTGRYAARTVNGVLAAVEDFHARLRLGPTGVPRARAAIRER